MSTYDLKELIKKWETEKLTTEQMIGQILLQLQTLLDRLGNLERQLSRIPSDLRGIKGKSKN